MAMKLFKNPAAKHYFKAGLKKNRKFFVICLILHMISFPLAFTMLSIDIVADKSYDFLFGAFFALSWVFTAIAVLLGVIIAIQNFSYLHKKQETDTYMSLPLSDKQRFFGDYFSGLLTYIAPVIISAVFTFITFAIAAAVINANPECGMSIAPLEYGEHTIGWGQLMIEIYLIAIVAMIMLYTIITLACTLCGSLFETIVHSFILNGAIPGMIALLCFVMFNRVPGVDVLKIMLPIMSKTSPLGAFIGYLNYTDLMNEAVFLFPFFIKFWLWLAVFTVLYVVIAFLAYKKRKAEDVAKPYVFKSYYYAIISCVTFAVCAIIPIGFDILLIPMIVVAAVAFLAFELITNRGFKKFGKSLIKCALTITASILLIGILDNGWGFGIGRRVPDADDVESVTIENMEMVMGVEIDYDGVEFFEKDAIEAVITAHTKAADRACDESEFPGILKDYYSYDSYNWDRYYGYDYARTTTITYKLKNGSSITREYKFNEEERKIISSAALMSKDYARNEADEFVRSNRTYRDEWNFYITVHDAIQKDEYTIATRIKGLPGDDWMLVSEDEYNTFVKEIAEAIEKDILDRTYEQVMQPYGYCGKIGYFAFYEYDENILATLEKYKMHITPISEVVKKLDYIPIRTVSFNDDDRFFSDLVQSDRQLEIVKQLLMVVYPAERNRPSSYYERLEEYSIIINGDHFDLFIPDEYSDIARELFDMAFEIPPARLD